MRDFWARKNLFGRVLIMGLLLLLVGAVVAGAMAFVGNRHGPTTGTASQPNIVFIMVDDMDEKLYPYMSQLKTLLTEQGTTFTNYLYNVPVCCPSRATALRGQYSQNSGVDNNTGPHGGYSAFYKNGGEASTIGTWLQDAGYNTAFLGKYLNGYMKGGEPNDEGGLEAGTDLQESGAPKNHVPPGWTNWYAFDGNAYNAYDYEINDNGTIIAMGTRPADYATDVMSAEAQNFLRSEDTSGKPFYLSIHPFAPHGPFTPADRHKNLFSDVTYPRNPNFNEADVSDKVSETKTKQPLSAKQIDEIDDKFRKRIRSLQAVDEMLAAIVTTLDEQGKLDNTIIAFASDNGFQLGEHRIRTGKLTMYEEAIRVPMVIRGPGIAKNATLPHLVGNVDLAPSFASAAGAAIPSFVDGRSFIDLARGKAVDWRNTYLVTRNDPAHTDPFVGIRTEKYSYAEYLGGGFELYDLIADPYQLTNIYNSASSSFRDKLHAATERFKTCNANACREADVTQL